MKKFLFVFFILGTITLSASGSLENVTRDRLIEKFKKVYIGLAPGDSSRGPVALRLADLLSERARLQTMEELGKDCGECRAGEKDRLEALKFYKVGLSSVPERSKGKVFAQMGHLYELLGEAPKARALYQDVINKKMGGMAEAEAYISLAEMAFKSGDFASAVPFYSNAIEHPGLAKKGYAIYRRAWSYFNQGNYSAAVAALTAMLKDPKLLTRSGDSDHTENLQFKEEVSRDLATFMARQGVGLKDANLLYSLSPDRTRLENVSYLAAELERLGQLKASAELWIFVQQKESDPLKRFEGQMHLAQVYWNLKDLKQAQNAYVNALDLWKAINGCQGENCSSYKSHMRAYLLEWHRVEKKAPSEALVTLYEQYLEVFPEDTVLKVNLARIQQQLKQWTLSYALYIEVLKGYDKNSAETKKVIPDQEALLTTLIDVAESSKEENLQLKSYQTYLDLSQARLKEREVRYQLAYIKYKKEDYLSAEKEFYDIATNAGYKGAVPLKVQAADLVLDILALLKKDDIVGQRASEFARLFPGKSVEYSKIERTSLMNQAAASVKAGGLTTAWSTLLAVDLSKASPEEKKLYLQNKFLLAEKLQKFSEAQSAVAQYLALPQLTSKERQDALVKQAWYAELKLDFKKALVVSEKLPLKELSPSQKWLKLALLAELAGQSYQPYYQKFLSARPSVEQEKAVLEKWVRESKDPLKTINSLSKSLRKHPELYGSLMLEEYLKSSSQKLARIFSKDAVLKKTTAAKMVWGLEFFKEYQKEQGLLASMTIDSSNQSVLAKSIKNRVLRLRKMESYLKLAIDHNHWGVQAVVIDLLATENERFYQELLSLPMPDGLNPEEQQQYLQLLSQQAAPHLDRANAMKAKRDEMINDPKVVVGYVSDIQSASPVVKVGIRKEYDQVSALLPESSRVTILAEFTKQTDTKALPTLAQLEQARSAVRKAPMNLSALDELMEVEENMGRSSMVAYLKGRRDVLVKYQKDQSGVKETSHAQ